MKKVDNHINIVLKIYELNKHINLKTNLKTVILYQLSDTVTTINTVYNLLYSLSWLLFDHKLSRNAEKSGLKGCNWYYLIALSYILLDSFKCRRKDAKPLSKFQCDNTR